MLNDVACILRWRVELKFSATPASMLSAACIITAANGLLGSACTRELRLLDQLHDITAVETVRSLIYIYIYIYIYIDRFSKKNFTLGLTSDCVKDSITP